MATEIVKMLCEESELEFTSMAGGNFRVKYTPDKANKGVYRQFRISQKQLRQLKDMVIFIHQNPETYIDTNVHWDVMVESVELGPFSDLIIISYLSDNDMGDSLSFGGDIFEFPFTVNANSYYFVELYNALQKI